jgi:hypothetical protein
LSLSRDNHTPQSKCRVARVLVRIAAGDDPKDVAKRFGYKSEHAVYGIGYRYGLQARAHERKRDHPVYLNKQRPGEPYFTVPVHIMREQKWKPGEMIHAKVGAGRSIVLEPV